MSTLATNKTSRATRTTRPPTPALAATPTNRVVGMPFDEQVVYLLETVGPRVTAVGSDLADARQLVSWSKGGQPRRGVSALRVAAMTEVTLAITDAYGDGAVAASFLRSSQPALDDQSPLLLIRQADEAAFDNVMARVRAALRAFLSG